MHKCPLYKQVPCELEDGHAGPCQPAVPPAEAPRSGLVIPPGTECPDCGMALGTHLPDCPRNPYKDAAVPAAGPDYEKEADYVCDMLGYQCKPESNCVECPHHRKWLADWLRQRDLSHSPQPDGWISKWREAERRLSALAEKAHVFADDESEPIEDGCCTFCHERLFSVFGRRLGRATHADDCAWAALRSTLEEIKKNVATGEGKG